MIVAAELLRRAEAARAAIREMGLDPELALSYVVWPGRQELDLLARLEGRQLQSA